MMTGPAVALTGIGLITAFGTGFDAFWTRLLRGESAIGEVSLPGESGRRLGAKVTADVCDAPPGERKSRMTGSVVAQALRSAGLTGIPADALIVLASQTPRCASTRPFAREFEGPPSEAIAHLMEGRVHLVHMPHACASAAFAASFARDWLLAGNGSTALVVGVSSLNPYDYASMQVARTLSGSGARPFDIERDGITLGEGGGALVLETVEAVVARGVRPTIGLSGGSCLIGGQKTADSSAHLIERCALNALRQAGLRRVDYVHAHATGTPQGDAAEAEAMEQVAQRLDWPVGTPTGSHKGAIGHLLHASALPGVAAAVGFLRSSIAPGTANLVHPLRLERIKVSSRSELRPEARSVLVNSAGFHGNYASLVFSALDEGGCVVPS